jgi:hypothetical protein
VGGRSLGIPRNSEIHAWGPSEQRLQARKQSGVEREVQNTISFVFGFLWKS